MHTLHIANKLYSSWSMRPWVLMRELGIPFSEEMHPFGTGSNWSAFRRFSPTGKVPCLELEGMRVWESLAIAECLAERHHRVWPADAPARAWARSAVAEMHAGFSALRQHCSMHCGLRIRLHRMPEEVQRDVDRICELWNDGFARFGGPYLAGTHFTAADAFYVPVAIRFRGYDIALDDVSTRYRDRLLDLDATRAWVDAARAEPWREAGHEAEIRASGTVIEDRCGS